MPGFHGKKTDGIVESVDFSTVGWEFISLLQVNLEG